MMLAACSSPTATEKGIQAMLTNESAPSVGIQTPDGVVQAPAFSAARAERAAKAESFHQSFYGHAR